MHFKNVKYMNDAESHNEIINEYGRDIAEKLGVEFDFDDFFQNHLFESYDDIIKSIEGIEQIYLMNIHYLYYYSNIIFSSNNV